MRFRIFKDKAGEYRWWLIDGGKNRASSSEGFKAKRDCEHSIVLVKEFAAGAIIEDQTESDQ
jgi:uncharacterized protein YegP (UPF0339 family)